MSKLRKLEFLGLIIRDFKSFNGEHVIKLDRAIGLHYVKGDNQVEPRLGSNGSGKTSIWDAVCWCLFGRTASGLKNPDVMPWNSKGIPQVTLTIKIDGKTHTIDREASKPMILRLNGKDVGQERIVELLRMDCEIATNTILIGQGQDLFFDRPAPMKMALFHDALNLDRWDDRSKLAAEQVHERERELAQFEGEARTLEGSAFSLAKLVEETDKKAKAWEREREVVGKTSQAALVKLRNTIEDLQRKIDGDDLAYDGARAEVKALESHFDRDTMALRNAEVDLQRAKDRELEISRALNAGDDRLKDLKKAKHCPTCGQSIKAGDLDKHKEEIESTLDRLEEEFKSFTIKPYQTVVDKLIKSRSDIQSHLNGFRQRAQSHLDILQRQRPELAGLKSDLKHAENDRKVGEDDKNPHTAQLRALSKRLGNIEADLEACKADIEQVEKEIARNRFWVKGFKDIKLHVVDEILQELQLVTDGMLEDIGLVGWRVHYVIERETKSGGTSRGLQVLISSPKSKGRVKWESWSGGEGQRLRIVGALALSQVLLNYAGVAPDMEVLDEPGRYFSGEGVHDLCDYLAERARSTGKRIYYCDHSSLEGAQFASTLLIIRDKAGSRLAGKGGR